LKIITTRIYWFSRDEILGKDPKTPKKRVSLEYFLWKYLEKKIEGAVPFFTRAVGKDFFP
jgi:hypothetical protein